MRNVEKISNVVNARLCSGVVAQVLYLCRKPRTTQRKFVNALLGCFIGETNYEDDYANKFLKCTKNIPTDVSGNANVEQSRIYVQRFKKVKELLDENKVENIINVICTLIYNDSDIRGTTVINEIEGIRKSDVLDITHFNFSEFIVGVFLYTIQNTINVQGKDCVSFIDKHYIEQFSDIKSRFSWGWTLLSGERGAIIAYTKKSEAIIGLLNVLEQDSSVEFFCVFGGVSNKLIEYKSCELFSRWLSKNNDAQLFLCYEVGQAAEGRARLLNPRKICRDNLPTDPYERMLMKAQNVEKAIVSFPENVKDRVGLIPIDVQLNHHITLLDDEVYWNLLTEHRSSENTTYKAENTPTGIKTKCEQLEYMLRILSEKKDDVSVALIEMLKKKVDAICALAKH